MDKDIPRSNGNLIIQFLENEFLLVGIVCFILYFIIGKIILFGNINYFFVYTHNHFQVIEILALIVLSSVYSIKEYNEINFKKSLMLSASYLSGSALVYCCTCVVLLGLALLFLPIIGFGTFVGVGIIASVAVSVVWFLNISILRFIYAFGTIFTVTIFIKAIKELIQFKKSRNLTLKSFARPIIILCFIPIFFGIYNLSTILINQGGTSKIFDIGYVKNPIVLSNGNSLWADGSNLEFYDFNTRKTFHISMPIKGFPSMTLLPDNKVLFTKDKSSYLFNSLTKTFIKTRDVKNIMDAYTSSIILPSNKVLFINDMGKNLQIFEEKTGKFYTVTTPFFAMWQRQGIALKNNKIFLYGGHKEGKEYYERVQIYDVSTNKFYLPKNQPKLADSIYPILLKNGKVLVIENIRDKIVDKKTRELEHHQTYEIYDPIYNSFSPLINNYGEKREYPSLIILNDGSVLIISHKRINNYSMGSEGYTNEAEIFYPDLQSFEQIEKPNNKFTYGESNVVLKDGRVVFTIYNNIEVYDPINKKFLAYGKTRKPRRNTKLIPLSNGEILIYGGDAGYNNNEKGTVEVLKLKKYKTVN